MECIVYLHNYIMMILLVVLVFVVYALLTIISTVMTDKLSLQSHHLEFIWTVIPMVILVFMAYPSLVMLYFMEAREGAGIDYHMKRIAHQWYWEYEYRNNLNQVDSFDRALEVQPEYFYTLETTKALVLPANQNILMLVRRADVLHAFTVPAFGIKVDAIPGRINALNFRVRTPGVYYGQCSEICGANHRFMPIRV